ncbi:hypothetical protein MTsPCn9_08180 [Croceitalea sp. MTPC9]|uniref:hypothetical protein n=1 Tax=unclassified Croceitalea TaxID=2632280 RepID=UPI002B3E45D1|nr:hypothetical protein MTsPCn6_00530 [Croceitalea sp. MTPC6]GMN15882.1 hypothetical protein MTsPCn9_08180 [Croceitalea sp. MTPC9]
MKASFLLPTLLLTSLVTFSNSACDNLYSKVTYAMSHSKKSLGATNFEHQMYYAERALTAMKKAEVLRSDCGCAKAEEKSYQAIQNLKKAIEPIDWNAGRFFTKKSKKLIDELITVLDECTFKNNIDTSPLTQNNEIVGSKESKGIDHETLKLAKYISSAEKRLKATEVEVNKLLRALNAMEPSSEGKHSGSIKVQQEMYIDKTKKLLQKALKELDND